MEAGQTSVPILQTASASETAQTPSLNHLAAALNLASPEICVICLDLLHEQHPPSSSVDRKQKCTPATPPPRPPPPPLATAIPCTHAQFHFSCLGTWLTHSTSCPLCKTTVTAISIHHDPSQTSSSPEIFHLPADSARLPSIPAPHSASSSSPRQPHSHRRTRHTKPRPPPEEPILTFRRTLYARQIPSSYLGRGVKRVTTTKDPSSTTHKTPNPPITHSSRSISTRPRKCTLRTPIRPPLNPTTNPLSPYQLRQLTQWLRRELSLFPFLNPTSPSYPHPTSYSASPRTSPTHPSPTPAQQSGGTTMPPQGTRPTTAPFLLPYTISIIQHIDLTASGGVAVELLAEYLGKGNARLLVHELSAFLRNGLVEVEEGDGGGGGGGGGGGLLQRWDEGMQYWFEREGEVRNGLGKVLGRVGG